MASKNSRNVKAKSAEAPAATTNFRQITGINQLVEARLHRAGIKTFEDLSNLRPEEVIASIGNLKGVSVKQIIEQDWVGQARKLAGKASAAVDAIESEGFIVNLFLSKKRQVHSTQVLHVNSDEGDKWDGWESQRLLEFIINQSGLSLPKEKATRTEASTSKAMEASSLNHKGESETTTAKVIAQIPSETNAAAMTTPPVLPKVEKPGELIAMIPASQRDIVLRTVEVIPSHSQTPSKHLLIGEPFDIRLSIDTKNTNKQFEPSLDYTAAIFAKRLDVPQRINLSEVSGVIASTDKAIVVNIPHQNLSPGAYSLEATLRFCNGVRVIGNLAQARTIFQVF